MPIATQETSVFERLTNTKGALLGADHVSVSKGMLQKLNQEVGAKD